MRKAALVYNPASGGSKQRQSDLESAVDILRQSGIDASLVPTDSPQHALEETRRSIDAGCDTIFACGGDGTIHNLVQVLANSSAALGVIPLGTANALAHDLKLPFGTVAAAKASLQLTPRRIALGRVNFVDMKGAPGSRYFIVAAGIGVDAHLFYKLHTGTKQRMGMAAYYAKAWHLWFSYPMTRFSAEYHQPGIDAPGHADVTELMAIRIRNFGGVLQELAPGASLDREDMRLVFCRTASRLAYLAYVTRGLLRLPWTIPGIDLAHSTRVCCAYHPSQDQRKIYVEADGELLGTLPAEITIVPNALSLLTRPADPR